VSVTQTNVCLHIQQLRDQNFKEEIIDNTDISLRKFPYKHWYIAGAAQCSIKSKLRRDIVMLPSVHPSVRPSVTSLRAL
jgi:hypothetical protein